MESLTEWNSFYINKIAAIFILTLERISQEFFRMFQFSSQKKKKKSKLLRLYLMTWNVRHVQHKGNSFELHLLSFISSWKVPSLWNFQILINYEYQHHFDMHLSLSLSLSLSQFTYPRIIPKISMRKHQVDPSKFQRNLFFELDKKILVTEYHIIAIYDFVFQKFWLQNLLPTTTQTLVVLQLVKN